MEITVELEGSPELIWDAIATANGISAWFIPTDLEERVGGVVRFHMGESASEGSITGWDAPRRLEYVEPDWAALAGREGAPVTPLVTEFLVEAISGGTCVLRVVTSAFGAGAEWEQEFLDDMERGWRPFFENLRLYLRHFPGQTVTSLSVAADAPGTVDALWKVLRDATGAHQVGDEVSVVGTVGRVERVGVPPGPKEMLIRVGEPVPGMIGVFAHDAGEGRSFAAVEGYLFSDDAPGYVEREGAAWKAWLEGLVVNAR